MQIAINIFGNSNVAITLGCHKNIKSDIRILYLQTLLIPVDITPLINKKIINQTIISQEADTTAETEFTLNIAQETKFVSGKVESLDFEKPLVKDKIDQLCDSPYLKEFWPMFLDIQDKTGLFEIA